MPGDRVRALPNRSAAGAHKREQREKSRNAHIHRNSSHALDRGACSLLVSALSGKSTLLNLLLDRNVKSAAGGGFAVGGTVQACTKGMW